MLKVKEGDLDKLGLLFERYNKRLYHFFYRLTHRRDLSEDLVQGVFERILKYRNTYTNSGSFATWIFQIARNLQADHYSQNSPCEQADRDIEWEKLEGDNIIFEKEQQQEQELELLQQAINQLSDTKKETLILSRFEGFRYKEIAEIMGCSESAVKVRIFRALQELEVQMKELKRNGYD
ncbi:RNA polymerase sigma factor [Aliifodinibius halophilus]|uniref:RNA polymerase sigma factor n=2 Tax=Fodinibius halophilus TaxID=1736908 RepID=A0A6M1TDC2_9BACT|nr:RNA polymerase sigma factor [Fodinibius halophilus]NGP88152.1 RNA polymerase sigma factor [Fodinibius halophilus]